MRQIFFSLLLIVTVIISTSFILIHTSASKELEAGQQNSAELTNKSTTKTSTPWSDSNVLIIDDPAHHPEDDGKTHCYHFDRIDESRKYACLYKLIAKLIIFMSHLLLLLAGYQAALFH